MEEEIRKKLSKDPNGLLTYEYIANHINILGEDMKYLIDNMIGVDKNGQFVVSTARYLHAIDKDKYAGSIDCLIKAAIDHDREHQYLIDLLAAIWGTDYADHVEELKASDDNFRRIYKRLFPVGI
ncbi:MAG: hypothetical protein RSC87_04125 [Muribaculaceae bacterium]